MYLPIYFCLTLCLEESQIRKSKMNIQRGLNPVHDLKYCIFILFPLQLAQQTPEDYLTPLLERESSTPWCQVPWGKVNTWKEHNSVVESYSWALNNRLEAKLMGLLLRMSLSSLWGGAAARGLWLPPGNNLSQPELHGTHPICSYGMGGRLFSMHS